MHSHSHKTPWFPPCTHYFHTNEKRFTLFWCENNYDTVSSLCFCFCPAVIEIYSLCSLTNCPFLSMSHNWTLFFCENKIIYQNSRKYSILRVSYTTKKKNANSTHFKSIVLRSLICAVDTYVYSSQLLKILISSIFGVTIVLYSIDFNPLNDNGLITETRSTNY